MILVISHATAWEAARKKYDINGIPTPVDWPVLLSFNPGNEEDAASNVVVITMEQAAKFLSICPAGKLVGLDAGTRSKIVAGMATQMTNQLGLPAAGQSKNKPAVYSATDAAGNITTLSGFPPTVSFKVGDHIKFNGNVYTIVAAATTISAPDPVTGVEGTVMFMDGENAQPDDKIPGLEEIPLDPGKFVKKDKIADLGDVEEHVLDDERDV